MLADFQTMIAKQGFDFEVTTILTFHCPPLDSVADVSGTPTSKSVIVRLERREA